MRPVPSVLTRASLLATLGAAALATSAVAQDPAGTTGEQPYGSPAPTPTTTTQPDYGAPAPQTEDSGAAPDAASAPDDGEGTGKSAEKGQTGVQGKRASGGTAPTTGSGSATAPTVSGSSTSAPTRLAYTGAQPLLVGAAGVALLLAAGLLTVRRRST